MESDQTPGTVAFDQVLHCMPRCVCAMKLGFIQYVINNICRLFGRAKMYLRDNVGGYRPR